MFIKGFDKKLRCRGFQFEIGKTYDTGANAKELRLCSDTVFHFCRSLEQVHEYYSVAENNRYCEIEVLGNLVEDDDKCGSNKIRIIREITGSELKYLRRQEQGNLGIFNTGIYNTGDFNTGDCNTGGHNTGNRNAGNFNTGDRNAGHFNAGNHNTGNYNTGDWNAGNRNTGRCNTGNRNTGDYNTGTNNIGDWNTGDHNTGNCNTGSHNTGHWNKCDGSTGFFNTKERTVTIFNIDSGLTFNECRECDWYHALYFVPFKLTEWISFTSEEKEYSIIRQCTGGYLKEYSFKEACANWWLQMSDENKALIQTMPNFDKDIFKDITGIDVDE